MFMYDINCFQAVDASILHHLDKIIVNILMCLYDEREMEGGDGLHRYVYVYVCMKAELVF